MYGKLSGENLDLVFGGWSVVKDDFFFVIFMNWEFSCFL